MRGPEKTRGRKGPHANVAPVAFRAASGDLLGNYTPKVAVFAHPTDATGTKGDFEGETTSIEASFDFHLETNKDMLLPLERITDSAMVSKLVACLSNREVAKRILLEHDGS